MLDTRVDRGAVEASEQGLGGNPRLYRIPWVVVFEDKKGNRYQGAGDKGGLVKTGWDGQAAEHRVGCGMSS